MTKVTKEEFFKHVENAKYRMVVLSGVPVSLYTDSKDRYLAKATWGYPETTYEINHINA